MIPDAGPESRPHAFFVAEAMLPGIRSPAAYIKSDSLQDIIRHFSRHFWRPFALVTKILILFKN